MRALTSDGVRRGGGDRRSSCHGPRLPEAQQPTDTPTFRVGTRLATIDAVVVDDKGQHVTDLKPEDFEIVERGKSQAVRQVVYVQVIGPGRHGRCFQPTVTAAPAPGASPAVA